MSKCCTLCGESFSRPCRRSHAQWNRMRFCSSRCANTWRARQQHKLATTTRREGERWARWWERQRRVEDRADIKDALTPLVLGPRCKLKDRPTPRLFIGSSCRGCGTSWVQYAKRDDSDLCSACTKMKWRMNHRKRAKHYGVAYEFIDPHRVFAADGYRCQLCERKTRGSFPNPRSPTIDHIIPMSVGGPHLRHNVQTACFRCNTRKHNGAANDQLRLPLVA